MDLTKPYPTPTPTTAPFWDGLRDERVMIQRCADCGTWVFYPRSNCSNCLGPNLNWHEVSGEGKIHTFTVTRQPTSPHFADEVPQLIAMIELNEGVRLTTTLVENDPDQIAVGAAVKPVFDHVSEDITLLRFQLT